MLPIGKFIHLYALYNYALKNNKNKDLYSREAVTYLDTFKCIANIR